MPIFSEDDAHSVELVRLLVLLRDGAVLDQHGVVLFLDLLSQFRVRLLVMFVT